MKIACMVALVTPMHNDGQIDYTSLATLIEWHIASGTEAIVILGTTGESPTLSHEERTSLIKATVAQVNKRIPVIVGTGTNSTLTTVTLSQEAEQLSADGLLIINPYYNKPTQQGLYLHFKAVNDTVHIPVILYNHPGRTGGSLDIDTIHKLSQLNNVIGLKETHSDLNRITEIRALCDKTFLLWSACDDNVIDFIQLGGNGVISATANLVPAEMKQMTHQALDNYSVNAQALQTQLMPLHQATCLESNPIPVKYALYLMKKIPPGIRLPLTPLEKNHRAALKNALFDLKLIPSISKDIL